MTTEAEEAFRRAAEQAAEALRQFGVAAEAAASAIAGELHRLQVRESQQRILAAMTDPQAAAMLQLLFGDEAADIAEHVAELPPAPYPYPELRRAIRYALADGMR